jgi:hypothetical protein
MSEDNSTKADDGAVGIPNLKAKPGKVYKLRKRYPPLSEMLAYGAPEDQGKPKTWFQLIAGPTVLVTVFFISFLIFINAPHHLSKGKQRRTFGMNEKPYLLNKKVPPHVPPVKKMEPMDKEPEL